MSFIEDTTAASQLVTYGLRPKLRPIEEPEYLDLVRRYRQEDGFARTVRAIADGMGVDVLDVTESAGAVLGAREGSAFATRMEDYYRRAREGQARLRVLQAPRATRTRATRHRRRLLPPSR